MKKILFILLVAYSTQTEGQTIEPKKFETTEMFSSLKETPDASLSIDILSKGASVTLLELYDDDTWRVEHGGRIGYMQEVFFIKNLGYDAYKDSFKKTILENEKAKRLIDFTKKYGGATAKKMIAGAVVIGWTKQMVIDAIGQPVKINRTGTQYRISEQWVYETITGTEYYYFENGKLTAWQD